MEYEKQVKLLVEQEDADFYLNCDISYTEN